MVGATLLRGRLVRWSIVPTYTFSTFFAMMLPTLIPEKRNPLYMSRYQRFRLDLSRLTAWNRLSKRESFGSSKATRALITYPRHRVTLSQLVLGCCKQSQCFDPVHDGADPDGLVEMKRHLQCVRPPNNPLVQTVGRIYYQNLLLQVPLSTYTCQNTRFL